MSTQKWIAFLTGFFILFSVYHFPEFFSAFWITATFKIGFLLVAFFLAWFQGCDKVKAYGLQLQKYWLRHLLAGLIIGAVSFLIYFFTSVQLNFQQILSINTFEGMLQNIPVLLLMTAIPSLAEDILTRGYLFVHLNKQLTPWVWVLLSALVYVLNHIWRLNDGSAVLSYLFFLGLVLGYVVVKTKSLWLAFGIHWGANITFELVNTSVKVDASKHETEDTFVLAAVWLLLFMTFFLNDRLRKRALPQLQEKAQ